MSYRLVITPRAQREIEAFVEYQRTYDPDFAEEQLARLAHAVAAYILATPLLWSYFYLTGEPYHGYLFRLGRRQNYWVVYAVDEPERTVHILRFWSASQDDSGYAA